MKYILVVISLIVVAFNLKATVIIQDDFNSKRLNQYARFYEDDSCLFYVTDFSSDMFDKSLTGSNFGLTRSCLWLKINIKNESDNYQDFIIENSNALIDNIEMMVIKDGILVKSVLSGTQFSFYNREISYRKILNRLNIPQGDSVEVYFLLNKQPGFINIPLKLWQEEAFYTHMQNQNRVVGLFFGMLVLYFFMCLWVVIIARERYMLFFSMFLPIGAFFVFYSEGFAFEYLIPERPAVHTLIQYFIMISYLLILFYFTEYFLKVRLPKNKVVIFIKFILIFIMLLIVILLIVFDLSIDLRYYLSSILSILILSVHLILFALTVKIFTQSKTKTLLTFSFSFFVYFLFIVFYTLSNFGVFNIYLDSSQLIYISSVFIFVLFSIVFVYKAQSTMLENELFRDEIRRLNVDYALALISGSENERKRIAGELHDGVGAILSAIKMKMSSLQYSNVESIDKGRLETEIESLDKLCNKVRLYSHKLYSHTLHRYGLEAALEDLVNKKHAKLNIEVNYNGTLEVDQNTGTVIYRVLDSIFQLINAKSVRVDIKHKKNDHLIWIDIQFVGKRLKSDMEYGIENVEYLTNLMGGKIVFSMDNVWTNSIHLELPLVQND
jgi:signal transduction histidine kinase